MILRKCNPHLADITYKFCPSRPTHSISSLCIFYNSLHFIDPHSVPSLLSPRIRVRGKASLPLSLSKVSFVRPFPQLTPLPIPRPRSPQRRQRRPPPPPLLRSEKAPPRCCWGRMPSAAHTAPEFHHLRSTVGQAIYLTIKQRRILTPGVKGCFGCADSKAIPFLSPQNPRTKPKPPYTSLPIPSEDPSPSPQLPPPTRPTHMALPGRPTATRSASFPPNIPQLASATQ